MSRGPHGAAAQDLVARGQQRILQLMARGRPLDEVLAELCSLVDRHVERAFCCVLLTKTDGRRLEFAAGPKVPGTLAELLMDPGGFDGTEAFGAAAVLAGRPWESGDLVADPGWDRWAAPARAAGLESWSALPILGPEKQVLGIYALGRSESGPFPEADLGLLRSTVGLASIAIQHHLHQEELRHRADRFLALATELPTGVFGMDAHGLCTFVNRAWCELAGMEAADALGEGWIACIHPEDRDHVFASWKDAQSRQAGSTVNMRLLRPDGTIRTVVARYKAVPMDSNAQVAWLGTLEDITERQELEEALITSERLARSILAASPIGIQVFDADGNSVAVNKARRMLPEQRDLGLDQPFNVLDDREMKETGVAEHYRVAYMGQTVERPVVQVKGLDGQGREEYFQQVLYPVMDSSGRVTAVVSMSRDITAQIQAERALREEKGRFEALVSNALDLIFTVDSESNLRYISPSIQSVLGIRPEEVLGTPAYDLLHPSDHEKIHATVQLMLDDPARRTVLEVRARHRDGSFRWLLVRGSNQLANPAVKGLVFNSSDITDLKAATEAVTERELRLRLVLEGTQDVSWDWDLTTGRVQHDLRWATLTGDDIGSSEHPVQSWAARVHPQDMPAVMEKLNAHLRGQSDQYLVEYRFLHRDGRWIWILDRGRVVQGDTRGNPMRFAGTMADITARKEAELALHASEERLRAVVSALPDTYLRIDAEGVVLDLEGHGEPILDLQDLPVGRLIRESRLPGPLIEALMAGVDEAIATGMPREFRQSIHAEGGEHHFEVRVRRVGTSEALCLLRDITERHHTEEYLRQSQKLESLGLLAGGIAHDFNNLFQGLMGNLNLAELQIGADSPAWPVLQRMEGIVRRAAELTQRLLDYSGKGFFLVKLTQLSQALMELTEMLRVPIPKHVTLRFDLMPDLPVCEIDYGQLQQVLLNLVTNAVEAIASKEGTITLATRVENLAAGPLENFVLEPAGRGPHAVLEVRDDGSGMDGHQLAHCFDPFFSTRFPGRGLGLPAALGILRRHKGGIRVQSELGKGSVFSLYFPVAAPAEFKSPASSDTVGTLLLADDEAVVRQVTGDVLRSLGYAVVEAVDGVDALEQFQKAPQSFSLAILDLVMPRMDGYATFKALRKLRPDLPVVFISGYSREEVPMPAEVRDHAGFLQKPFQMSQLAQVLDRIRRGS
jgi:PAS domain S-box-containing protein